MAPEITNRAPIRVMGMPIAFTKKPDFKAFWDRFMAREKEIAPLSAGPGWYAVDYNPEQSEESGGIMYVPGMAVGREAAVPDGLVARDVPGGEYAGFPCRVGTIQKAYDDIESWLKTGGYDRDTTRPGIEYYAPGPDLNVVVYVPVKAKT